MKNSGFSLIELLIANAVASIIILGAASLWTIAGVTQSDALSQSTANDIVDEVRTILVRQSQCTENFAGLSLTTANPRGTEVQQIKTVDASGVAETILSKGETDFGVTIDSIRLRPVEQITAINIEANLEIYMRKIAGLRTSVAPKTIGIVAQVQGGKIQKCWIKQDNATTTANLMCATLSHGALNEYDVETGTCKLANGKWYSGDSKEATCPPGTVLPERAAPEYNCRMIEPAGFKDSFPEYTVQYSQGKKSASQRRAPYHSQLNRGRSGGCKCSYATDLGIGVTRAFNCGVQCVVL